MRKPFSTLLAAAGAGVLAAGMLGLMAGPASAVGSGIRGDFNGDGYRDVALGSDGGAGRVTVIYGSAKGLAGGKRVTIDQNSTGVPGTNETGDRFGGSLAAWMIGIPGENGGDGAVIFRGPNWSSPRVRWSGAAGTGDRYGSALAP